MTQEQEKLLAISKNFICHPDQDRGHGWCKFSKGNYHVWQTRSLKWQTAYCIDNYFRGHGMFNTLEDAFNRPHIIIFEQLTARTGRLQSKPIGPYVFEIEFHRGYSLWMLEVTDIHLGKRVFLKKNTSCGLSKYDAVDFCKQQFKLSFNTQVLSDTPVVPTPKVVTPVAPVCECGKDKHNFFSHLSFCPKYKK